MNIFRFIESGWFIPTSIILLGGLFIVEIGQSEKEINKVENEIQETRVDLLRENKNPYFGYTYRGSIRPDKAQTSFRLPQSENLYPNGNPHFKKLSIQSKRSRDKTSSLASSNNLRKKLDALKKVKRKRKIELPRALNNPVKRQKAIKMLTDTYKVFNRDIGISSRVVEDAINKGTRTEAEIDEALDAIKHMKSGRRMLIEKIQLLEEANSQEDLDSEGTSDEFLLPEDE